MADKMCVHRNQYRISGTIPDNDGFSVLRWYEMAVCNRIHHERHTQVEKETHKSDYITEWGGIWGKNTRLYSSCINL